MRTDLPIPVVLNLVAADLEANGKQTGGAGMKVVGPHCVLGAFGKVLDAPREGDVHGMPERFEYEPLGAHPAVQALAQGLWPRRPYALTPGRTAREIYSWSDENHKNTVVRRLREIADSI